MWVFNHGMSLMWSMWPKLLSWNLSVYQLKKVMALPKDQYY